MLSRRNLIRLLSMAAIAVAAFTPPPASARVTDDGCTAGGPGASQCSFQGGPISCSVTCRDGWYACCGLTGCSCKGGIE